MTGDIYRGTLSAKEMSELKAILTSILTKLETNHKRLENKLDKLEIEKELEASHRKTLAIYDKAIESFRIASRQIDDPEKVSDKELQPEESADLLENVQINLTNENQVVEFSIPDQTDVILRRQGEHAEQKLIEKICVENFDSDEVKAKENISECDAVSFVSDTPCKEKENVSSLCMPKPSIKTEIVGVKASRANCFASYIIVSNRLNDSKRVLLSFKGSFEMFRPKQLYEVLQISVPTRNSSNKLEHQGSKRSKRRYRNLHRYNPLYWNLWQNFRGGIYTKKNEGRK
jgi:hypothetical protein